MTTTPSPWRWRWAAAFLLLPVDPAAADAPPRPALAAELSAATKKVLARVKPNLTSARDRYGRPGVGLLVKVVLFRF
jgi:hypothetical protein